MAKTGYYLRDSLNQETLDKLYGLKRRLNRSIIQDTKTNNYRRPENSYGSKKGKSPTTKPNQGKASRGTKATTGNNQGN